MYDKESYRELWAKALHAVESNRASFTVSTGDVRTADDLSGLLGAFDRPRPVRRQVRPGGRPTVTVAELDHRLRRGEFGRGLRELLETLTGEPVLTAADRHAIFLAELSRHDLADGHWVAPWLDHCRHPGRIESTEVSLVARQCAAILAGLVLAPDASPVEHRPLESIAEIYTGSANGLSPRKTVGQLVLRALSLAHGRAFPKTTHERWLLWLKSGVIMDDESTWDIFTSHANEDKEGFVRPLAAGLARAGLRVWYDEYTMRPGDSIRESIDHGLQRSQAGLLVVSPHSFREFWTRQETNGLFSMAEDRGTRLIPVLHGLDPRELKAHSSMLSDRCAIRSDIGVAAVVDSVLGAVDRSG